MRLKTVSGPKFAIYFSRFQNWRSEVCLFVLIFFGELLKGKNIRPGSIRDPQLGYMPVRAIIWFYFWEQEWMAFFDISVSHHHGQRDLPLSITESIAKGSHNFVDVCSCCRYIHWLIKTAHSQLNIFYLNANYHWFYYSIFRC